LPDKPVTLVLDAPIGWALCHPIRVPYLVIISDNPCPEYRLALLEQRPLALLSGASLREIASILKRGAPPQPIPYSPLSDIEQLTLRLIALGHSNSDIAEQRGVAPQTVKNAVRAVYQKLNLSSRVGLAHYYFGNWYLLLERGWLPPGHLSVPEAMIPIDAQH
jgi:DNA-binding CsgD family transcriptional regulator